MSEIIDADVLVIGGGLAGCWDCFLCEEICPVKAIEITSAVARSCGLLISRKLKEI